MLEAAGTGSRPYLEQFFMKKKQFVQNLAFLKFRSSIVSQKVASQFRKPLSLLIVQYIIQVNSSKSVFQ